MWEHRVEQVKVRSHASLPVDQLLIQCQATTLICKTEMSTELQDASGGESSSAEKALWLESTLSFSGCHLESPSTSQETETILQCWDGIMVGFYQPGRYSRTTSCFHKWTQGKQKRRGKSNELKKCSWVWCLLTIILAHGRLREENYSGFEAT